MADRSTYDRSTVDEATADAALERWCETRDASARGALAECYDWLALHAARRFRDRGEPYDDLVQVARLGLLKAMDRFDPEIGTPFGAYATVTMVGELRRHFRDTTWQVHVPRRIKDLQTSLRTAIESLTHELGRPPRPAELAERLGVSEDVVLEALDGANAYHTDSLDSPSNERFTPGLDRLASEQPSQENSIDLREAIAHLPDRERRIIELRYFEGWSQSEIAEHVGISQVHVSRLLRATLGTLQTALTT